MSTMITDHVSSGLVLRVAGFSRLPYPVGKSSTIDESFLPSFGGSVVRWFLTLSQFQSEFWIILEHSTETVRLERFG